MKLFSPRTSKCIVLFTWLLLAASFADYINLTDLFPDNVTLHSDDDVDVQMAEGTKAFLDQFVAQTFTYAFASPTTVIADHNYVSSKRIIIDQDSPFLESTLTALPETIVPIPEESPYPLPSMPSAGPLHLLHCTLLI